MAGKWTLVFGFESKLDDCNVSFKNDVLHEVAISRKGSDERPNELLEDGRFSLHKAARDFKRPIVRVVGHDAVLIGSTPRGIVFGHERFDIGDGSECSSDRHGYVLRSVYIQSSTGQGESKYGTARLIHLCPQPASMDIDDRPA